MRKRLTKAEIYAFLGALILLGIHIVRNHCKLGVLVKLSGKRGGELNRNNTIVYNILDVGLIGSYSQYLMDNFVK